MAKAIWVSTTQLSQGPSITNYATIAGAIQATTTEANAQVAIQVGGTLEKLAVQVSANTFVNAPTVTVRKAGADGNLTVSITGLTTGVFQDTTHTDSVTAGNKCNYVISTSTGVGLSFTIDWISVVFDATSNTYSQMVVSAATPVVFADNTTRYAVLTGLLTNQSTEAGTKARARVAYTGKKGYVNLTANDINATSTVRTRKNGANGGITISITANTTGVFEDTSGTDTLAAGDDYNFQIVATSVAGNHDIQISHIAVGLESTNANTQLLAGDNAPGNQAFNTTRYYTLCGRAEPLSTESITQVLTRIPVDTKELTVLVQANSIATSASTLRLRKNTANGNQTASITNGTTGIFSDSTNKDGTISTDVINASIVTPNTSGNLAIAYVGVVTTNEGTKTVSADAVLVLQKTKTVSADAVLKQARTKTVSADAALKKQQSKTVSADAALAQRGTSIMAQSAGTTTQIWPQNSSNYGPIGSSPLVTDTDETIRKVRWRTAGTISRLLVVVSSNSTTDATTTLRSRVNASNGNQVISIPPGVVDTFEDTYHTDSVAAGDDLSFSATVGTDTDEGAFLYAESVSILFAPAEATGLTFTKLINGFDQATTAATNRFMQLTGQQLISSESAQAKTPIRFNGGTLKNLALYINANARTSTTTFRTRKNGTNGSLSVSVTSTSTGLFEDTSNSDTLSSGDLLNYQYAPGAGSNSITISHLSCELQSYFRNFIFQNARENQITISFNTTAYLKVGGYPSAADTSESTAVLKLRRLMTLTAFDCEVHTNSITTSATSVTVRRNNAATASTVSVAAGATGLFTDSADSVSFSPTTDTIDIQVVTPNTSGSFSIGLLTINAQETTPTIAANSKTVSADAVLKKLNQTKTVSADAALQKAQTKTVNVDATLKTSLSKTISADAVLKKAQTKTISVDAALKKIDNQKTVSADAYLTAPAATKTVLADAALMKVGSVTVSGDSVLKQALTKTVSADSTLKKLDQTKTVLADAALKKLDNVKTVLASAALQIVDQAKTVAADAVVVLQGSKTVLGDAVLKQARTKTVSADATLKKLDQAKTVTAGAALKLLDQTKTVNADAALSQAFTKTVSADAALLKQQTKTVLGDSVLKKEQSKTISADAVLKKAQTKTVLASAALQKVQTKTTLADAALKKLDNQKTVSADAYLVEEVAGQVTVLADAVLKTVNNEETVLADAALQQALTKTVSADGVLKKQQSKTALADAALQKVASVTVLASAALKQAFSKTVSADAYLVMPATAKTVLADAVLKKLDQSKTVLADAFLSRKKGGGQAGRGKFQRALLSPQIRTQLIHKREAGNLAYGLVVKAELFGRARLERLVIESLQSAKAVIKKRTIAPIIVRAELRLIEAAHSASGVTRKHLEASASGLTQQEQKLENVDGEVDVLGRKLIDLQKIAFMEQALRELDSLD